jgi:hypothetical protein
MDFAEIDNGMSSDAGAGDGRTELPVAADALRLIQTDDTRFDYVPCPEWGVRVRVRSLTSKKRAEYEKKVTVEVRSRSGVTREMNLQLAREWLVIYGAVKEDGTPLFGSEHLEPLRGKSAGVISRVCDAVMRLSGMTQEDVEKLTEELEASPSSASSTG